MLSIPLFILMLDLVLRFFALARGRLPINAENVLRDPSILAD